MSSSLRSPLQSSSPSEDQATGQAGEEDDTAHFLDGADETIVFPFHGSCPKCHHLHTNKPFRLPLNFLDHFRLRCEKCGHQMFGFGRTSTQTTLASVESIPLPQRSNLNPSIFRPSPRSVCISPPAEDEETAHRPGPENLAPPTPLSTIDESQTPAGRSRSSSNVQTPNDAAVGPEGTANHSSAAGPKYSVNPEQPSSEPADVPRPVQGARHPFAKLKNVWNRAVDNKNHDGRRKRWKLPRIIKIGSIFARRGPKGPETPSSSPPDMEGVDLPYRVQRGSNPSDQINSGSADTRIPSRAPTRDLASSHRELSPDPSDRLTRERDNPTGVSGSTTRNSGESEAGVDALQSGEQDDISSPSTNTGQPTIEPSAEEIKRDRLRVLRREKTLRKEAAAKPECRCLQGCPCYGVNRASGSDVTSETQRSLNSSFEAPDHPLQHLWTSTPDSASEHRVAAATSSVGSLPHTSIRTPHFSGIGGLFNSGHQRVTFGTLTQAYRLSQATTIPNGSTSSISLAPYPGQPVGRRPGPSIRSRSPVLIQRQELHPSSTSSDADSGVDDFRNSSEETIADGSSIASGITAPVTPPDAQHGLQTPIQGQSASLSIQTSNIVTVNGSPASESQTATPRPSDNNELSDGSTTSAQPEPAAISSALRDINHIQ